MRGLVAFSLLASLVIGLLFTGALVQQQPAITAALAEQEQAKAEKLRADADVARAQAAQAWIQTEADRQALPEIAAGKRWAALGVNIAIAILAVGSALAIVTWANFRAHVVYPNAAGQWPILIERKWGGALLIADTSRGLGPLMIVGPDGAITQPLPASEASALQLATQAQASGVMVGVASRAAGENVIESVSRAAENTPVPTFASAASADVRMVYVKNGAASKAQRELQDIEEFIRRGWTIGLSRSLWLGKSFSGTGNRCTRNYYDQMTAQLARAGVIVNEAQAWKPAVTLDEALDAFGLAHEDP